jgi:hypothetical protein
MKGIPGEYYETKYTRCPHCGKPFQITAARVAQEMSKKLVGARGRKALHTAAALIAARRTARG